MNLLRYVEGSPALSIPPKKIKEDTGCLDVFVGGSTFAMSTLKSFHNPTTNVHAETNKPTKYRTLQKVLVLIQVFAIWNISDKPSLVKMMVSNTPTDANTIEVLVSQPFIKPMFRSKVCVAISIFFFNDSFSETFIVFMVN